jgi:hypothetical protein
VASSSSCLRGALAFAGRSAALTASFTVFVGRSFGTALIGRSFAGAFTGRAFNTVLADRFLGAVLAGRAFGIDLPARAFGLIFVKVRLTTPPSEPRLFCKQHSGRQGNEEASPPSQRMHNHRYLRLVSNVGTKATLVLLLDIPQPAKMHFARLTPERTRRRLTLDR